LKTKRRAERTAAGSPRTRLVLKFLGEEGVLSEKRKSDS